MKRDFQQIEWDAATIEDCRQLVRLAVREDLERQQDWTTLATVAPERRGAADIVSRQAGYVAGIQATAVVVDEMGGRLTFEAFAADGDRIEGRTTLGRLSGSVRDLLTCERIVLNILGRMMGVATLASLYVEKVAGTNARIYDTRKTTPGWRRLEKFAVRCGGAHNHRLGLYDAVLIKDNHLAQFAAAGESQSATAARAVQQARKFLAELGDIEPLPSGGLIEIEVDSLEQLAAVLPEHPEIVLLDNMSLEQLRSGVALRNSVAPEVELEASGGVNLETVRGIAETGVDRISVGGITHAAKSLDVGLDWHA
ncbi:carboxylating nicotinate-nucleotide diphosphorylase [Lacipirellula parvula]|uniref:Probable nicotinate-nucleotide pyrophosphorylase [carboxylating] n=1 Tax=Lacipirellula parvula TaxID=2650471 RepID=A0A5K7XFL0_9BACT|nr:carboxylating nicotinate-nucleotide diphosphorylase [Lacipirellula parvula]BBO34782.1 quinolinate phosphoribosyltransferase [Lacipirellula parvula]